MQQIRTAEWKWGVTCSFAGASWLYPIIFCCRSCVELRCTVRGVDLANKVKEGLRVHDFVEIEEQERDKAIRVGTEVEEGDIKNDGNVGVVSQIVGQIIFQSVE